MNFKNTFLIPKNQSYSSIFRSQISPSEEKFETSKGFEKIKIRHIYKAYSAV